MSLVGIHFTTAPRHDGFAGYIDQAYDAGSAFAGVFCVDQNVLADVERDAPSMITVFRHQVKDAHGDGSDDATLGQGDPTAAGLAWIDKCEPTFKHNPGFTYYCATNELNPKNQDHHRWAASYWLAQMQRADELGRKIVWGNFSAGNPEIEDWGLYYQACVSYAVEHGHPLGLHEYGLEWGAMRHAADHGLTLRYRSVYQQFRDIGLGWPRLIISECAPGSNVDDNLASLLDDLNWYDACLMADKARGLPVEFAAFYNWGGAEAVLFQQAMPTITAHVINTPGGQGDVTPPPPIANRYRVTTEPINESRTWKVEHFLKSEGIRYSVSEV